MGRRTYNLDELARTFIKLFGKRLDEQTPPGAVREEQQAGSGAETVILTGDWAMRVFEYRLLQRNLDVIRDVEDPEAFLDHCIQEGREQWPDAQPDADGDFWKIVAEGGAYPYLRDMRPTGGSKPHLELAGLMSMVVRCVLDVPGGEQVLALAVVREKAATEALATGT